MDETDPPAKVASNDQLGHAAEARWYCLSREGMATLCACEEDAKTEAANAQENYPRSGPYRAVQLCDAAEIAELDALRDRLSGILNRTAVALRGPEPPLTRWSWHDLPERAAAAIAAIALVRVAERERCAKIAEDRPLRSGMDEWDSTAAAIRGA